MTAATRSDNALATPNTNTGYFTNINEIRQQEYPQLQGVTYLDHSGTALYAHTLITTCSNDLKTNLFGNPHSGAESSMRSSRRVEDTRLKLLQYCNASPSQWDAVFVANATAAIKLVAEGFRDHPRGFDYAYHEDCHNSVVGVRELAQSAKCITSEQALDEWLVARSPLFRRSARQGLFAYPGQSNLTGDRPDPVIGSKIRQARRDGYPVYCLLDAAALASTSEIDLSDPALTPDFVALSLYKIFGYPDLGALLVRKEAAPLLLSKKYFAGGTVDAVTTDRWYARHNTIHEALEEGTVPFHNIFALGHALDVHKTLFGNPRNISRHAQYLVNFARGELLRLRHGNDQEVCRLYGLSSPKTSGPVIAFNLIDPEGRVFRNSTVEAKAIKARIHLRKGGMCNPGGIAKHLDLTPCIIRKFYSRGVRCSDDSSAPAEFTGALGMVRVSFGAMSSIADVEALLTFTREQFIDTHVDYAAVNPEQYVETSAEWTRSMATDMHEKAAKEQEEQARHANSWPDFLLRSLPCCSG